MVLSIKYLYSIPLLGAANINDLSKLKISVYDFREEMRADPLGNKTRY